MVQASFKKMLIESGVVFFFFFAEELTLVREFYKKNLSPVMLDECTTELFLSLLSTIFPTVCMHTWAFMERCFTRATVKEIVIAQSRNQSPQATWTVGGRWNRLWGNGKIDYFDWLFQGCSA